MKFRVTEPSDNLNDTNSTTSSRLTTSSRVNLTSRYNLDQMDLIKKAYEKQMKRNLLEVEDSRSRRSSLPSESSISMACFKYICFRTNFKKYAYIWLFFCFVGMTVLNVLVLKELLALETCLRIMKLRRKSIISIPNPEVLLRPRFWVKLPLLSSSMDWFPGAKNMRSLPNRRQIPSKEMMKSSRIEVFPILTKLPWRIPTIYRKIMVVCTIRLWRYVLTYHTT